MESLFGAATSKLGWIAAPGPSVFSPRRHVWSSRVVCECVGGLCGAKVAFVAWRKLCVQMSAYVNRTRPRVPTELTVPKSAKSTPRARGGLCLAAGIYPGWVEGMVAVGQTGTRPPWIWIF